MQELITFIESHVEDLKTKLDDIINWSHEQEYIEGAIDASEVILYKAKEMAANTNI